MKQPPDNGGLWLNSWLANKYKIKEQDVEGACLVVDVLDATKAPRMMEGL